MGAKRVTCPKCGKPFGILDRQVGSEVFCPHCGQKMKTVAPKAGAESLQEAAATQIHGGQEPSGPPSQATRSERGTAEAARAMKSAFGTPAGASRRPPPPPLVAEGAPRPGSDTRLAHHLGLDQQSDEHSALARAPVRSKGLLWVWVTIIVLALGGIIIGIVVQRSRLQEGDEAARVARAKPPRPPGPGPGPDRSAVGQVGEDLTGADVRVLTAEELAAIPPPLVFHRLTKGSLYYENPQQREVLIGYVENVTDQVVRRAILNIKALGGETKKIFGEDSQVFCDVKPGEKPYVIFDYPFVNERGTGFEFEVLDDSTTEPEYEFEVTVGKVAATGSKSGEVVCELTNNAMTRAPVVDVLLVFFDRQRRPSGYARDQLVNLKPGETRQVTISWRNWESEYVRIVEARAQVGSLE